MRRRTLATLTMSPSSRGSDSGRQRSAPTFAGATVHIATGRFHSLLLSQPPYFGTGRPRHPVALMHPSSPVPEAVASDNRNARRTSFAIAALALTMVSLVACGGGPTTATPNSAAANQGPAEVMGSFLSAFSDANFAKACPLMTATFQQQMEQQFGLPCAQALAKSLQEQPANLGAFKDAKVLSVSVKGDDARAIVQEGNGQLGTTISLPLHREAQGWRVVINLPTTSN